MPSVIEVESVTPGFAWTAYGGCKNSQRGALKGTADRIVTGWKATEAAARRAAQEAL